MNSCDLCAEVSPTRPSYPQPRKLCETSSDLKERRKVEETWSGLLLVHLRINLDSKPSRKSRILDMKEICWINFFSSLQVANRKKVKWLFAIPSRGLRITYRIVQNRTDRGKGHYHNVARMLASGTDDFLYGQAPRLH